MSAAYLPGVREHLPEAQATVDRYHVKQKLSEAVDTIRRAESKQHRELLRGTRYLYDIQDPDQAAEYLRRWSTDANASGLEPIIAFTEMLQNHWDGVIRWHHTRVSNGLPEGLNSLIQAAKRRARRIPLSA